MKKNLFLLLAVPLVLIFSDCYSQSTDLPEPSESHKKNSKVIGWPEGKTPVAPDGFVVTRFADKSNKLDNPRWIYVTPNGDILVSQSKTNKKTSPNNIIIFRDADKNGTFEVNDVFMSALNQPLGMLV